MSSLALQLTITVTIKVFSVKHLPMQTRQSIHHALLQDSGNFISVLPAGSMAANGNTYALQGGYRRHVDAIYQANIAIIRKCFGQVRHLG